MPAHPEGDKPVVLHAVSYDVSRGAERYARALVDVLNEEGSESHLLLTMFRGDEQSLGADVSLGVQRGPLRRLGFDPRVVSRMRREIARLEPVAMVAHGGEPAKYAAFAATDLPFAYLVIGSSHPLLNNPIRRAMRDFYVRRASAIVAVSSALAQEMKEDLGVPSERIHVIPNGRDPDVYKPVLRDTGETPRVLFVGHLDRQKRPELFIEAMAEVAARGVQASGMMVGGGPLRSELESQAMAAGVELLGPRGDVPDLLAHADLLVMTSRPPEGMPGVLIEAGLSGLATVTTDVPGSGDVGVDGVTGRIVGVDDHGGLVDAIESLLLDPEKRQTMGRAARERCLEKFSLALSAIAWRQVLEGIRR